MTAFRNIQARPKSWRRRRAATYYRKHVDSLFVEIQSRLPRNIMTFQGSMFAGSIAS